MTHGDCYSVHGKKVLEDDKYTLCHGIVHSDIVGWHGHCWLEYNYTAGLKEVDLPYLSLPIVHDESSGHNVEMSAPVYYLLGQVKDVKRYTSLEAAEKMDKTGNYGPWDE